MAEIDTCGLAVATGEMLVPHRAIHVSELAVPLGLLPCELQLLGGVFGQSAFAQAGAGGLPGRAPKRLFHFTSFR